MFLVLTATGGIRAPTNAAGGNDGGGAGAVSNSNSSKNEYASATAAWRREWQELWDARQRILVPRGIAENGNTSSSCTDGCCCRMHHFFELRFAIARVQIYRIQFNLNLKAVNLAISFKRAAADVVPLPSVLGQGLASYVYDLPPSQLQKAVVYAGGPNARLRAKLAQAGRGGGVMKVTMRFVARQLERKRATLLSGNSLCCCVTTGERYWRQHQFRLQSVRHWEDGLVQSCGNLFEAGVP